MSKSASFLRTIMDIFRVTLVLHSLSTLLLLHFVGAQDLVTLGFPDVWDGDKYRNVPCVPQNVPPWLDGYLLTQVCASYGNQANAAGSKVTHMFDAIGAIASVEFRNGQVYFSGEYYPAKPYNVWSNYNRNMSQTHLAWHPVRSAYNETAVAVWEPNLKNDKSFPIHPNFNFWQIGNNIVAVTEIFQIGLTFNVSSLTNFYPYGSRDEAPAPTSTFTVLSVGSQERNGSNGSVYVGAVAYDPSANKMYHIVYNIRPDGQRTVEGMYEYEPYEPSSCSDNGTYNGDTSKLAGYIHSITSTKSYVILPIGSNIINPCKLNPLNKTVQTEINGEIKMDNPALQFIPNQPVKVLLFDKANKRFNPERPIEVGLSSVFITDQVNAYEDEKGIVVIDMIGYENINPYDLLTTEKLLDSSSRNSVVVNLYRIEINPQSNTIQQMLSAKINYEQPTINRLYEGLPYKFAYAVSTPFLGGNSVVKINVATQEVVGEFKSPKADIVLREPWYVPNSTSTSNVSNNAEDNGVVMGLAGDVSANVSSVYILDAKTMSIISCVILPTFVPFGFHTRYFDRSSLICDRNCQTLREMEMVSNQGVSNLGQIGDQTVNRTFQPFYTVNSSTTGALANESSSHTMVPIDFDGFTGGVTRIDNVTVFPPETGNPSVVTSSEPARTTNTGNTLIYQTSNDLFTGDSRSTTDSSVQPLDTRNSSSSEFFRTTTVVVDTTQSRPSANSGGVDNNGTAVSPTSGLNNNGDGTGGGINSNNNNMQPNNNVSSASRNDNNNLSSGNNCIPSDQQPNWLRLVNTARSLICAFLKKPIDDSGFDFCQFNNGTNYC